MHLCIHFTLCTYEDRLAKMTLWYAFFEILLLFEHRGIDFSWRLPVCTTDNQSLFVCLFVLFPFVQQQNYRNIDDTSILNKVGTNGSCNRGGNPSVSLNRTFLEKENSALIKRLYVTIFVFILPSVHMSIDTLSSFPIGTPHS